MKHSLFCFLILLPLALNAQYHQHSVGARLGGTSGITYKTFMNDNQALQFLLSGRSSGIQATITYHFYKPINIGGYDTFFFYYGPGGHAGIEKHSREVYIINEPFPPYQVYENQTQYVMGVNAIAGVEYRLISVPLVIGFDIKPYLNYIGMRQLDFRFWDAALTVKYAF